MSNAPPATAASPAPPVALAHRRVWLAALPVMLLALVWPALWNGFPLIGSDTGGYLMRPFEGTLTLGRSALYGAFLAAGMPLDFWPNVAIQAALAIWVILVTLRVQNLGRPGFALVVVLALAALTSLPWFASQLMPDIFALLAVLACYLLAFHRDALSKAEALGLGALIAVAIASHMATLALCLLLLAGYAVGRLAEARLSLPSPRIGAVAIAIVAGVVLAPLSNLVIAGQFAFTPGGTTFVFGRLVQDGLIAKYLGERCPDPSVKLCAYRADLPPSADEWLWSHASPLFKLGNWNGYADEQRRIILETLRLYPGLHLATAVKAAAEQFVRVRTSLSVRPEDNIDAIRTFERMLPPPAVARFHAARQQSEKPDIGVVNLLHLPAAYIGLTLLLVATFGRSDRRNLLLFALCSSVLLALLANAMICGVFSIPSDRYQNRLVPLAVLCVAVALGGRRYRESLRPGPG